MHHGAGLLLERHARHEIRGAYRGCQARILIRLELAVAVEVAELLARDAEGWRFRWTQLARNARSNTRNGRSTKRDQGGSNRRSHEFFSLCDALVRINRHRRDRPG